MLQTLRYEDEIKDSDKVFADIAQGKLREDLVGMAKDLITSKTKPFDASAYKNHYAQALRDLVKDKLDNHGAVDVGDDETRPKSNVLDFMEALKRSVSGGHDESGQDERDHDETGGDVSEPVKPSGKKARPAAAPLKKTVSAAERKKAPASKKAAPKKTVPRRRAQG